MFEKEAEQYVDNNFYDLIEEVQKVAKVTFKDGAEFGYNKANEWHYVKDGDLPKETGLLMSKTLLLVIKKKLYCQRWRIFR